MIASPPGGLSRRRLLNVGARLGVGATLASLVPRDAWATRARQRERFLRELTDGDTMRALALRAVDAATSAGASYADVRVTRTVTQDFLYSGVVGANIDDSESRAIGVRALVDGRWGFAASPYWTDAECARLGKEAVAQARASARAAGANARRVELIAAPAATGEWTSPGIDPFSISVEEKVDNVNAWRQTIVDATHPRILPALSTAILNFERQERVLASSEGTLVRQTLLTSGGNFGVGVRVPGWRAIARGDGLSLSIDGLHTQRAGWELFTEAHIPDQIPALLDRGADIIALFSRPPKPAAIGRYDVVFDAISVANILAQTLGPATQLDRALGYEANAGGTSLVHDPLSQLGTFHMAAPLVTVTADRSTPRGSASIQWDDEGIVPTPFTVVDRGVLTDMQTTREQVLWIAPYYTNAKRPLQSHGCASALSALDIPLQTTPNLTLSPGPGNASFNDLIAATSRGYAVMHADVDLDFQGRGGFGRGLFREIVDGKLGAVIDGASFQFDTIDWWKNIVALGGASSTVRTSAALSKGEPRQRATYGVSAVPAHVQNVSIVRQVYQP